MSKNSIEKYVPPPCPRNADSPKLQYTFAREMGEYLYLIAPLLPFAPTKALREQLSNSLEKVKDIYIYKSVYFNFFFKKKIISIQKVASEIMKITPTVRTTYTSCFGGEEFQTNFMMSRGMEALNLATLGHGIGNLTGRQLRTKVAELFRTSNGWFYFLIYYCYFLFFSFF